MVQGIKTYRQMDGTDILKVFCKPTQKFPEGSNYFYVDANAEPLVNDYTWYLLKDRGVIYVAAYTRGSLGERTIVKLHQALCNFYTGDYAELIDHYNTVGFDNTDINLNIVTIAENNYNSFVRGYSINRVNKNFQIRVKIDCRHIYPFSSVKSEIEACKLQHTAETEWLQEQLSSDTYHFNILEYRRGSEDILDLERTGQISHEEANYRHILKYADNAWYYYRYGLEDFFKEHHIPVPEYSLDDEGYMVDKITGKKLCPFYK